MLETWILEKLEPLAGRPLIILRDPQRMIRPGAMAVDGWAERNGYAAPFCHGNLALREMYEALRDEPGVRVLLVDRSRDPRDEGGPRRGDVTRPPLFYPDLSAAAGPDGQVTITLRDCLAEVTGDPHWPPQVNTRRFSRLILADLEGALRAHGDLRRVHPSRFTDTDLYRIILGARLGVNAFHQLTPEEVRRVCVQEHDALQELARVLPKEVFESLQQAIRRAPEPFCRLLDGDAEGVIRAFTLAAIMRQHDLDYRLLLPALSPQLHPYRDVAPQLLEPDRAGADVERLLADVAEAEEFLLEDPGRVTLLLRDQLRLDDPAAARRALECERLSPLVRGVALLSLFIDLVTGRTLPPHREVAALLDRQSHDPALPALRRPGEAWRALEGAYLRALRIHELAHKLQRHQKRLKVTAADALEFDTFDAIWNRDGANRLDYYVSGLQRMLRLEEMLPAPLGALWPEVGERWKQARGAFDHTVHHIANWQNVVDARFQDLCRLRYKEWILEGEAPAVFTHQFLSRLLKAHWDPRSSRKAVILVFDGMRTDAWDELLRPVLEERFEIVESRPGCALLPTETQLSRKAIAAGCLPEEFPSTNELHLLAGWTKANLGFDPRFQVVKDDDTAASGISVRYTSEQLEYIVFDFTDQNLHHNTSELALIYDTTVREIIRHDVRSVLRGLPADALLFVTSDHGFAAVAGQSVTVPEEAVVDRNDVRYRYAYATGHLRQEHPDKVLDMDIRVMGLSDASPSVPSRSVSHVLFPRPSYGLRRPNTGYTPDRYTHGGLSLAECMVPMVVMGPPRPDQPPLVIDALKQIGSRSEGQPLTVEITIKPLRIAQPDTAVALTFSEPDIPPRRELVGAMPATVTVIWEPRLDVTADEREAQVARRPLTVILTYQHEGREVRSSRSVELTVKLDPTRVHRRLHTGLDMLMGMTPKGLK